MTKLLKPRNYYELTYSAIPDNKIKQVSGNYNERIYSDEMWEYKDINQVIDCRGDSSTTLPCVTTSEQATTDNHFCGVFHHVTSRYYDSELDPRYRATRYESVWASVIADIYSTTPMKYTPGGVTVDNVRGVTRIRTATGAWSTPWGTWVDSFDDDEESIYCIANYNKSGPQSDKEEVADATSAIDSVTVDTYYNGERLGPNGKYLLRLTIMVRVLDGHMDYDITEDWEHEPYPTLSLSATLQYDLVSQFSLSIVYQTRSTESIDFEYHVSDADYQDYPLSISGNEFINTLTTYTGDTNIVWAEWISNQILDMYQKGKYFINTKIKASYITENNIDIDSEIIIKDINNRYVSRKSQGILYACVFKVKNIEYNCVDSSYSANVVLLEDRTIQYTDYVINSNNIRIVTSDNIKVILRREIT